MTSIRNNKKKILIVILFVMAVLVTSRTHATPLYGGYNGESEAWFEYKIGNVNILLFSAKLFLGVDVNDHRWAKLRISIPPNIVRFDLTYDSADILSINVTTLLPWPVQFGTEIDIYEEGRSLWWFVVNVVTGITGADSEDTRWVEAGIPGVSGSGYDSKGNQWTWFKVLDWLFGAEIEGELLLQKNHPKGLEEELLSLQEECSRAYAGKINVFLEKLTAGNAMKDMVHFSEKLHRRALQLPFAQHSKGLPVVVPLGEMQSELDSLSATIAEEVFTEETKDELQKLLNNFARDSQPTLRKISETMTAP